MEWISSFLDTRPGQYWISELNYVGVRYFLFSLAAFLFFYGLIGFLLPHKKIQKRRLKARQVFREIAWSVVTIFIFASIIGIGTWAIYEGPVGHLWDYWQAPTWAQWLLVLPGMLLVHDTYFYWVHRAMHTRLLYRTVHAVHHQSTDPTSWSAFAFHPLEAVLEGLIVPILFWMFPADPQIALGYTITIFVFNVVGHSGYEIYPHRFLRWPLIQWILTSTHHNMHHPTFNYNFGLYFNIWDRLLGTVHPAYVDHFEEVTSRTRSNYRKDTV